MGDATVVGVFVGGRATRFGGIPKGLLPRIEGGPTIVEHFTEIAYQVGATPVLVGAGSAYEASTLFRVLDDEKHRGPMGGLAGLLSYARGRHRLALVVACDMPFVQTEDLRALIVSATNSDKPAVIACAGGRLQPFFSALKPASCPDPTEGVRSMMAYFQSVAAEVVQLPDRVAHDWDQPSDLPYPLGSLSSVPRRK